VGTKLGTVLEPGHPSLHGIAGVLVAGKQRFYFLPQRRIVSTTLVHQGGAVFRGALGRAMEQLLDLSPAFRSPTHRHSSISR
jgi:hypothetical protein